MDAVENEVDRIKPRFLIIDSIQTMMNRELNNAAGSVTQIREATTALTRIAKQNGCAIFIIGHVTKEGALAGPRMLEHMVDTVLYLKATGMIRCGFSVPSKQIRFNQRDRNIRNVPRRHERG